MPIIIRKVLDLFSVCTPPRCTVSGRDGRARLTRFCTWTCAVSGLVPIWKETESEYWPAEEQEESMYNMLSTPFTCVSMGAATAWAIVSASAPGYEVDTVTTGGEISGYCAIGRLIIAPSPAITMTRERTIAKIGRWIQNREIKAAFYFFSNLTAGSTTLSFAPGLILMPPSTTTISPPCNPSLTNQSSPCQSPSSSGRCSALPSAPTIQTKLPCAP